MLCRANWTNRIKTHIKWTNVVNIFFYSFRLFVFVRRNIFLPRCMQYRMHIAHAPKCHGLSNAFRFTFKLLVFEWQSDIVVAYLAMLARGIEIADGLCIVVGLFARCFSLQLRANWKVIYGLFDALLKECSVENFVNKIVANSNEWKRSGLVSLAYEVIMRRTVRRVKSEFSIQFSGRFSTKKLQNGFIELFHFHSVMFIGGPAVLCSPLR